METTLAEALKKSVLTSLFFRKSRIETLKKKPLEHFMAIFSILSY